MNYQCQPGMEGRPLVVDYDGMEGDSFSFGSRSGGSASNSGGSDVELARSNPAEQLNARDIERAFEDASRAARQGSGKTIKLDRPPPPPHSEALQTIELEGSFDHRKGKEKVPVSSSRLDELLSQPIESRSRPTPPLHRRSQSAPVYEPPEKISGKDTVDIDLETKSSRGLESIESFRFDGPRERSNSGSNRGSLVRINSFGEVQERDYQPSLLDQARLRSATSDAVSRHRRIPSVTSSARPSPRHSRKNSESSVVSASGPPSISKESGTLSIDDIEQTFKSAAVNSADFATRSPWTNNDSSDAGSSS
jgi:hypothetical protein